MKSTAVRELASDIRSAGRNVDTRQYDLIYSLPEVLREQANVVIRNTPDWSDERIVGLRQITDAWKAKITPLFDILARILEEHEEFLTTYLLSPNGARRYPKTWLLIQFLYSSYWGDSTNKPLTSILGEMQCSFIEAGISERDLPEICDRLSFILVNNKTVEYTKGKKKGNPLFDVLPKIVEHQQELD